VSEADNDHRSSFRCEPDLTARPALYEPRCDALERCIRLIESLIVAPVAGNRDGMSMGDRVQVEVVRGGTE